MTRRDACRLIAGLPALSLPALSLLGQNRAENRPDSFRAYTEAPRLLLRPARLRLLKRERERMSLRWEQFESLWTAGAPFPELGWAQALRYQIADDRESGTRAVAWAVGPGDDIRQVALIADWCAPILSADDRTQIFAKLRREIADTRKVGTLAEARAKVFAAIVLSEAQPDASEKALQAVFDGFWSTTFIPFLRGAKGSVSNSDAYAMLEILHVVRDNLNFDLRDTFPQWFGQYPMLHLMAHYPAPFPGNENEYHIPADEKIQKEGPDLQKAVLSRAAELAMVAFDSNAASSQLLQGWNMNDRFLMRGALGIPYEFLWANPYQPGLSYYHVPLALHDEIGGQLFVRSSWEDNAQWVGFFGGQLQLFRDGEITAVDPKVAQETLDIDTAVIFFARQTKKFGVPKAKKEEPAPDRAASNSSAEDGDAANVFLVGLEPKRAYHVEIDGEEMVEHSADPGGIIFLPDVEGGLGVRLGPAPTT
jgi:hypothetical protein